MSHFSSNLITAIGLTTLAMIAFAANSVFNRLALATGSIDPGSFTVIRLVAGAIMLGILVRGIGTPPRDSWFDWRDWAPALYLFTYAVTFSYAYLTLTTGTGALILFGAVQITLILATLASGNRLQPNEWLGLAVSFGGLVYLNLPGVDAPPASGLLLMLVAGIAWGFYTISGRGSDTPLDDTARNFCRSLPLALLLGIFVWWERSLSAAGVLYAVLSGAIASGVGYAIWYSALRLISTTQAAVVQLSVPLIAAWAGAVLLSEAITLRLVVASALILGGILLVFVGKSWFRRPEQK